MNTNSARRARRGLLLVVGAARTIRTVSYRVGRARGRREAGRSRLALPVAFAAGAAGGLTAEYLLDPEQGKRRRHVLRDWTLARLRRGKREAGKQTRYMAGKAQGVAAEATTPGRDPSELNDPALEAKVETELFRPPDAPKDKVDVSVQDRVVVLRGEVASREQLRDLIERAAAVDGVARTESLLHLPGEPAPSRS